MTMAESTVPVVTVDGPSGVGKGTLCRLLAQDLGWNFLDSGALYRLTALAALRAGIALTDEARLARLARDLDTGFRDGRALLNGADVSAAIRSESCGDAASQVAALPAVRQALLQRQRDFRRRPGLVADGRDMGTIVFPDAPIKFFLTASAAERAFRRYNQLRAQGIDASLAALADEIAQRDERDAERSVAPLRPAGDAIVLDTTDLGIEAVKERALSLVRKRLQNSCERNV